MFEVVAALVGESGPPTPRPRDTRTSRRSCNAIAVRLNDVSAIPSAGQSSATQRNTMICRSFNAAVTSTIDAGLPQSRPRGNRFPNFHPIESQGRGQTANAARTFAT
jgi:hypothetical protein